ncbi:hypothetical protein D4764_09G0010540 [Takifugu flavidus]|uniref:Uncharacterized protein n=1 Tax=Takifugu flavidus TaxID=433684 RepID=A0A5C6MLA4_9TELE|nr:hypothetical protein D4764_09G0010540 [Takifugu flavidus]
MPAMAASSGVSGFEKLTRRHGVKLSPPTGVSMEECALAVGKILVMAVVVINGALTPVFPLSNPAKKVVVLNVPPFLKNNMLLRELSLHGRVVSQMRLIPLGSKSPEKRRKRAKRCGHNRGGGRASRASGGHLGDHLDLQSECLTRELVEQTTTRVTETVLDMEDVGVEENSLNVSIKRKSTVGFQASRLSFPAGPCSGHQLAQLQAISYQQPI